MELFKKEGIVIHYNLDLFPFTPKEVGKGQEKKEVRTFLNKGGGHPGWVAFKT